MSVRAKIVEQKVCEGTLGFIHGMFHYVRRLIVEDYGLVITVDGDVVHAFFGDIGDDHEIIGETDVPSEIFSDAMLHASSGRRLRGMIQDIKDLTGEPSRLPIRFDDGITYTTSSQDDGTFMVINPEEGVENEGPRTE